MGYPISAFCLVQIVSKVVPMCFSTPNAGGVMVHDDLERDPELKFEVSDILATFLMGYPISAFFSCSNRLESGSSVFLDS